MSEPKNTDNPKDASRRTFLKFLGVVGIAAASIGILRGAVQNIIPTVSGATGGFPTLQLVSTSGSPIKTTDLKVNDAEIVLFNYPLTSDPNFLLRLGDSSNTDVEIKPVKVTIPENGNTFTSQGGVGPYKSVVASSAICEHLGCKPPDIHFYPLSDTSFPGKIHCSCHGSTYDPFTGFSVVNPPTHKPLPNTVLSWDQSTDTYYAVGMAGQPTIFGQTTDLSGGTPFSSGAKSTQVTREAA